MCACWENYYKWHASPFISELIVFSILTPSFAPLLFQFEAPFSFVKIKYQFLINIELIIFLNLNFFILFFSNWKNLRFVINIQPLHYFSLNFQFFQERGTCDIYKKKNRLSTFIFNSTIFLYVNLSLFLYSNFSHDSYVNQRK